MVPQLKQVIAINQTEATNAATATGVIDTLNYDWLTVDIIATTSDDTTNNPSVLKLSHCDTSNGTFTDVPGCVGDTDFDIPAVVTEGNWGAKFNVDLLGLARWLKVTISPLTTVTFTAIANLGRGKESPVTSTKAGVNLLVEV